MVGPAVSIVEATAALFAPEVLVDDVAVEVVSRGVLSFLVDADGAIFCSGALLPLVNVLASVKARDAVAAIFNDIAGLLAVLVQSAAALEAKATFVAMFNDGALFEATAVDITGLALAFDGLAMLLLSSVVLPLPFPD